MELDFKIVVSLCLAYLLLVVFFVSFIIDTGGSSSTEFSSILNNKPDFNNIDISEIIGVNDDFVYDRSTGTIIVLGNEINVRQGWGILDILVNIGNSLWLIVLLIAYAVYSIFQLGASAVSLMLFIVIFMIWIISIFAWVSTSNFIPPLIKIFLIVPPTVLIAYLSYQIASLVRGK